MTVSRGAFQTLLFGFRVPFLGWILRDSLTTIAYLSVFTRACMYGCVFFSGLLMAIWVVFHLPSDTFNLKMQPEFLHVNLIFLLAANITIK